jgi:hypothetical protein
MLVKPMVGGVHVTVIMDCCHSGTVMDLPYKYGADDAHMTREEGFNMEIAKDGEKARKEKEDERPKKEKKKKDDDDGKDKKKDKKDKDKKKKKKKDKEEEDEDKDKKEDKKKKKPPKTEEERERQKNIVVGPKIGANGAPLLPVRAALEKPAPTPNKKCSVM